MDPGSLAEWFSGSMSAAAVAVALGLARKSSRDAAKMQLELHKATAHRALAKLVDVGNSIDMLHRHLMAGVANPDMPGPDGPELWRKMQPLVGFGNEEAILFGAEEATLMISANEIGLLMDLMVLGRRHAALVSLVKEYGIRREALIAVAPPPRDFEGKVGSIYMDEGERRRLRPYAIALEGLIQQLVEGCAKDRKLALDVSSRFGAAMRKYLEDDRFPLLKPPASRSAQGEISTEAPTG